MTTATRPGDPNATAPSSEDRTVEQASGKRPYRAPQLKRLGSVRELTLGGTGTVGDGLGNLQPFMM